MTDAPDTGHVPTSDPPPETEARRAARRKGRAQACRCAQLADDMRGADVVVLDLAAVTPIADYFVIVTGTNRRQLLAIADECHRWLKSQGSQRLGLEGDADSPWVLLDYGDIVLHLFVPEARSLYDLEHLWADAPRIDWRHEIAQGAATDGAAPLEAGA